MSLVTADKSPSVVRSPPATNVETTLISLVTAALVLPALSVWVTVMISSPSPKLSPASLDPTVKDQMPSPLPSSTTVVLLPPAAASVCPLPLKEMAIAAPISPVPEIVNPVPFSTASTISSVATASIANPVGITLSMITPARESAELTFPARSVAVTLTV